MIFEPSPRVKELQARLLAFFDEHIYPNERLWSEQVNSGDRWKAIPLVEDLKTKARALGPLESYFSRNRSTVPG
jgi:acyl-CoA dehydrogenase